MNQYGSFDLDPAATRENRKAPEFYSKGEDGLIQKWAVMWPGVTRVFVNPPYGREVGKWVERAYRASREENCMVVMLLKVSSDTAWWHDYVMQADEIQFIRQRVRFIGPGKNSPPFPSAVVVFRPPSLLRWRRPKITTFLQAVEVS